MSCWWHRKLVNTEPILLYGAIFLLMMIALLLASSAFADSLLAVDDYLCRAKMEEAMKAHEKVMEDEKAREAMRSYTISNAITIAPGTWRTGELEQDHGQCSMYYCKDGNGAICYRECPQPEYVPDTRTPDQKLDDEIKEIEKRRSYLREEEQRERERKVAETIRKRTKDHADRLWAEAKTCWRNP